MNLNQNHVEDICIPKKPMVMDDQADIRRGLIAERRSLFTTSFILFFYQQAGLKIDKVNVFGNEATISDPWWIAFALWVLWVYFGLRYLQYFMVMTDTGFQSSFNTWMKRLIRRFAFARFKKKYNPGESLDGKPCFVLKDVTFPFYVSKVLVDAVGDKHSLQDVE